MPRKSFRRRPLRRAPVPRKTQKLRKLVGQSPLTTVERISRIGGNLSHVARTVSMMTNLINSENKYVDTNIAGTIDSVGSYFGTILNAMAEGDDVSQRNGRKILAKDIALRATVECPSAGAPTHVGYALVLDRKSTGTYSAWDNVFTAFDPDAPVNRNESDRYVILKRGVLTFSPNQLSKHIKIYTKLNGIHMHFTGAAANTIDSNAIFFIAYCSNVGNEPVVTGYTRFNYYDN